MNVKNTDRALLRLIRQSLFSNETTLSLSLREDEWKCLLAKAEALGVTLASFHGALALPPSLLPKYLPDAWSELAFRRAERSERILAEQSSLTKALRERRTPMLLLADTAAAAYYPNPSLRTVTATDCLCDRPINDVTAALTLEFPLSVKQGLSVVRDDALEGARLRSLLARALDSCTEKQLGEYTLPVPSVAVQALLLLLAAEKKPSLLLLADWAVLMEYALKRQDVNMTMQVRSWEQCGLLPTAKKLSLAASLAFNLEIAEWFADADKAECEAMLASVLTPDGGKLARAEKNLEIAMQRAARKPKGTTLRQKKSPSEKNAFSRLFDGLFKKK